MVNASRHRKKARIEGAMAEPSLRSDDATTDGSLSESHSGSSRFEEYGGGEITPFMALADLLDREVSNYLAGGVTSCRCILCPLREFSRPCRVRMHVERYHARRGRWCASGKKQMKLCVALYDNDMETNENGFIAMPNILMAVRQMIYGNFFTSVGRYRFRYATPPPPHTHTLPI